MSEKIFGVEVNLDFDESAKPYGWLTAVTNVIEGQMEEIKSFGLEITKVQFNAPEAPPRFFVKFPKDKQQWEVRKLLEQKGYDVGQKIGPSELAFYVTKRLVQSKGWTE